MVGVIAALGWVSAAIAERFDFQFLGEPGATIRVTRGEERSMSFPGSFRVVGSTDNLMAAPGEPGFLGNISGSFRIGGIATYPGGFELGSILPGANTLTVTDGNGDSLTAKLSFANVFWFRGSVGVEFGGAPNLSDIQYSGSKPDLGRCPASC